jgi:hypothetical protein
MAWIVNKKVISMAAWYFKLDRFRQLKMVITKGHIFITGFCGKILKIVGVGAILIQDILL